jgi:hypothetical protein
MAQCAYCNTETQLFVSNVPICVKCADQPSHERRRASLTQNLADATLRADAASETFQKVMADIPSTLPHPDGVQRIKNASQQLAKARDEMTEAHKRLEDHLKRE